MQRHSLDLIKMRDYTAAEYWEYYQDVQTLFGNEIEYCNKQCPPRLLNTIILKLVKGAEEIVPEGQIS